MTVADLVGALVAANASPEVIKISVDAFVEASGLDEKKVSRQERNRRYYSKRLNKTEIKTSESVLQASETVLKPSENAASRVGACVLYGEDSLIKELPTVDRKIEPDQTSEVEAPKPVIVSDLRKAKKAADSRTLDFVGEGWNALCAIFPRMARIGVIPDGGKRETGILARTKELLKDFDQPDAEAGWKVFFGKIRASPFLRGEAPPSGHRDRAFKPTLDSLTAPQMFLKIMEDHYVEEIQPRRAGSLFDQRRQWG